jgi:hypothetical protein
MLRTALAMFLVGGIAASGQAQKGASGAPDKVDRATAYYHYTLAHMYAEMASASGSHTREYMNKSIENYKAAVKADPQTPPVLLQGPGLGIPVLWLPAAQPRRTSPKADPSK